MEPEQTYLRDIILPLVKFSNDVDVQRTNDERGILLTLSVHPEDMGRVIGKQGQTAISVRHLLRQYGLQNKARIALKINEPPGSHRYQPQPTARVDQESIN